MASISVSMAGALSIGTAETKALHKLLQALGSDDHARLGLSLAESSAILDVVDALDTHKESLAKLRRLEAVEA